MKESITEKAPLIHWVFFWTAGASTLFVWNCVLSLTDYLESRFDPKASKYYPFFYNFGSFFAFLVYDLVAPRVSFKRQIMAVPVMVVAIFIVIFMLGEHNVEPSSTKFASMLSLLVVQGFANSLMLTTLMRYTFEFTYIEISCYTGGTALVGILTTLIAMMNGFLLKQDDYYHKGLYYLIFQVACLVFILAVFSKYLTTSYTAEVQDPSNTLQSKVLIEGEELGVTVTGDHKLIPHPSFWSTTKIIAPFMFNMILIYTISLSIFPKLTIDMGLNWKNPVFIQVVLLIFNIGDFIGKSIYAKLPMADGPLPLILSLLRIVMSMMVVFIFGEPSMPGMRDHWHLTSTFTMLLAISNGYLTSAFFSLGSERAPENHKQNAGFLMTFCLLLGLIYGSLCMILGTD